ncbi:ABC transporter ATP-binding protein [Desulfatiglans anilini]|uniref:ABC transporter ATP-binding protein n=1 Tax=Desulfatiglans anilini TaxID=90728 RepID=UPI0024467BCC|nr:ABC transporter ATP-binding protein [Desulfatiglans anilini]
MKNTAPSRQHILPTNKGPGPDRCVIFQEDALFPWLTVGENIAFGLKGRKQSRKARAEEMSRFLNLVGLNEFRDYLPHEISGGMKQRVALARVLILRPEVLLMDEPFAALDAQSREEMQCLLLMLWQELGHTILFVTHDVGEAVMLADRILLMSKNPGRIREEISVSLPRPREREGAAFAGLSRRLHEALRG